MSAMPSGTTTQPCGSVQSEPLLHDLVFEMQTPLLHPSSVQALPSLHGPLFAVWVHVPPVAHTSSVHALPSSQFLGIPEHLPPVQASPAVHALPSSQGTLLSGG